MERVVAVNLAGHAYTVDESAYGRLKAYLDCAHAALAANPDRDEIMRDLEQAIAEKCARHLGAHRSVVSDSDIAVALEEMGPVEGAEAAGSADAPRPSAQEAPSKRLYRLRDGAVISGVCSGVGAYFTIDANIIRLLFIVATLVTGGGAILAYIAMMFIVPSANTREEWAQAHGLPFNAQEVIERAKEEYARFANDPPWGRRGRKWRRRYREWRRAHGWHRAFEAPSQPAPPRSAAGYAARAFAGLCAIVFTIISAAFVIAFLFALFSLLTAGTVLSWAPPASVPLWFAIVALVLVYVLISTPLRMLRHWAYATMNGYPPEMHRRRHDGFGFLAVIAIALVIADAAWPEAHAALNQIPAMVRDLWASLQR